MSARQAQTQPVVFVATANTTEDAQEIHRRLWNLSNAPFIIIDWTRTQAIYDAGDIIGQIITESTRHS